MGNDGWRELGKAGAEALRTARLQAHWALQAVAAFGIRHVAPRDDDGHTATSWDAGLGALVGDPAPVGRWGLRLSDRALLSIDDDGGIAREERSAGRTLDELLDIVGAGERPSYDLPDHPLGEGARFEPVDPGAAAELAAWFANGALLLEEIRRTHPRASPVRAWPHHFDIATLLTFDDERSIGIGMEPGDDSYDEPYFYVRPDPAPDRDDLPSLDGPGHWHREGWTGAVLPASDALLSDGAAEQERRLRAHLRSGLEAARTLIGAD